MGGTAGPLPHGRARGWALPARPPEEWVGGAWSVVLTLLLGAALVVPLTALLRTTSRAQDTVLTAVVGGVTAAACAAAAWALLVQGRVLEDPRLPWAGAGLLLLHPAVLVATVTRVTSSGDGPPAVLLLGALPAFAGSSGLALLLGPRLVWPALALPALLVAGVLVSPVVPLVLAVLGLALWWPAVPPARPHAWLTAGLVLGAVPLLAVVSLLPDGSRDWPYAWGAVALVLPCAGLVADTRRGYVRQARRWRELVQEVRDSRIPTALLPGRSVVPEDDEGLPDQREVEAVVRDGAVLVALQPVLRLVDGEVVGVEALARFGGRIPTDRWFRGAARCGLGLDLEVLCLERALELLPDVPHPRFLAVNVSPAALVDARALAAFEATDLSRVVVEVTEHEAVADYPGVRAVLRRLRDRGARIAVDDTGAGYASLRHVLLLQPEVVKLDTALVRDLGSDPRKRALVVALTTFAQEVGSTVLAEGIETPEHLQALLEIGVDLGQGWHLGVPVFPGEEQLRTGR